MSKTPFGRCRLQLWYFAEQCTNPATGPDELCDECRDELRDADRASDENTADRDDFAREDFNYPDDEHANYDDGPQDTRDIW